MKLVREIRDRENKAKWGIYKLSDEQAKKFGNNFAVSQGVFSDYCIEQYGEDWLLERLDENLYEGFFETHREAELHVELAETNIKLNNMKMKIKDIIKVLEME